ncbi:unnamed protein product [Discula destructiva]
MADSHISLHLAVASPAGQLRTVNVQAWDSDADKSVLVQRAADALAGGENVVLFRGMSRPVDDLTLGILQQAQAKAQPGTIVQLNEEFLGFPGSHDSIEYNNASMQCMFDAEADTLTSTLAVIPPFMFSVPLPVVKLGLIVFLAEDSMRLKHHYGTAQTLPVELPFSKQEHDLHARTGTQLTRVVDCFTKELYLSLPTNHSGLPSGRYGNESLLSVWLHIVNAYPGELLEERPFARRDEWAEPTALLSKMHLVEEKAGGLVQTQLPSFYTKGAK